MAAGPVQWYPTGLLAIANGGVDFLTDTIKAALLVTAHTVDLADDNFDDVSADECADGDYAQVTLGTKTVAIASGKVRFDSADISFGNPVTISARYLVIYKDTGTPATSTLLGIQDLNTGGGNLSSVASTFSIPTPNGIFEIEPNPA